MTSSRDPQRDFSSWSSEWKWRDGMERCGCNTLLLHLSTVCHRKAQSVTNEDPVRSLRCVHHVWMQMRPERTRCDWPEASGVSSRSTYVTSVLSNWGIEVIGVKYSLFGLTACSQAAGSFRAQDVWTTRQNWGKRETRAFQISAQLANYSQTLCCYRKLLLCWLVWCFKALSVAADRSLWINSFELNDSTLRKYIFNYVVRHIYNVIKNISSYCVKCPNYQAILHWFPQFTATTKTKKLKNTHVCTHTRTHTYISHRTGCCLLVAHL